MNNNFYSEIGKKGAETNREKSIRKYYEDPAYCKNCGKMIEVYDNEIPSRVRQRVFCSSECHSEFQSQKMIGNRIKNSKTAYCVNCGVELKRHQNKYCSNQCQNEFQYKEYIEKWKSGEIDGLSGGYNISTNIKRYIKEKYNNKCCECGWDKINPITKHSPLEIHHIDGDYKNNSEENLILLCPNCHSLTENYKALNKNGRKERTNN